MDAGAIIIASLPGLITGLLGFAAVLVQAQKDKRHVEASATQIITDAAKKAVEIVMGQLDETVGDLKDCKETLHTTTARVSELERADADKTTRINVLRDQVVALGATPRNGAP